MDTVDDIFAMLDEGAELRKMDAIISDVDHITEQVRRGELDHAGVAHELAKLAEKHGLTDGSTRQ